MNCPNCRLENVAGARSCIRCGTALEAPSPESTEPLSPPSPESTEPLSPPSPESTEPPPPPPAPPAPPTPVTTTPMAPTAAPVATATPVPPVGPPVDRWPTVRRWLLGAATVAAVALAVGGIAAGRLIYLAAAWTFAVLPIGYAIAGAIRRSERVARLARVGAALALVGVLGASTLVASQGCAKRLGTGADLSGCDLSGVDLSTRALDRADLSGADLSNANLRSTSLRNANLRDATLTGATIRNTNLDGAVLDGADLRNLDLTGARLDGASLNGAKLDGADLHFANLDDVSMRGVSASGANLEAADLDGVDLSDAGLDGARMSTVSLVGATLSGASLRGTELRKANLSSAKLDGATLENVQLDGATMIDTTGLADPDLASALGVSASELGGVLTQQNIRLELRDDILQAVGSACRGGGARGADGFSRAGFSPLVILDGNGGRGEFTDQAAKLGWEPMAARFTQLVACVDNEETVAVEHCLYTLQQSGQIATVDRNQYRRRVRVVQARNGSALFDQTYQGSTPRTCPLVQTFYGGATHDTIEGSHVNFNVFKARIQGFVR